MRIRSERPAYPPPVVSRPEILPQDFIPLAAPITRIFTPDEVDVDDLAEAIRRLLEGSTEQERMVENPPLFDLRSQPSRGSHVVEATHRDQWP